MDELSAGRFFTVDFRTMPACSDSAAYAAALKQMIVDWKITVVLPTVAEEPIVIREALEDVDVDVILSPAGTLRIAHDKRLQYRFIEERFPEYAVAWQTAAESSKGKVLEFLKPAFGRGARGCRRITLAEHEAIRAEPTSDELILM